MKTSILPSMGAALLGLGGCGAPEKVAVAPATVPTPVTLPAPTETAQEVPTMAPTASPKIVQSGRASLPPLPQMMDNSPRPTYIPLPTPKVRPGQTIIVSNARPTPRENPTIIVSNAPVSGRDITPQVAAARELVWVDATSQTYHRPGSRLYGATANGYYLTETQAQARGFRVAAR